MSASTDTGPRPKKGDRVVIPETARWSCGGDIKPLSRLRDLRELPSRGTVVGPAHSGQVRVSVDGSSVYGGDDRSLMVLASDLVPCIPQVGDRVRVAESATTAAGGAVYFGRATTATVLCGPDGDGDYEVLGYEAGYTPAECPEASLRQHVAPEFLTVIAEDA